MTSQVASLGCWERNRVNNTHIKLTVGKFTHTAASTAVADLMAGRRPGDVVACRQTCEQMILTMHEVPRVNIKKERGQYLSVRGIGVRTMKWIAATAPSCRTRPQSKCKLIQRACDARNDK